jgi:rod shape-determining protein MreD
LIKGIIPSLILFVAVVVAAVPWVLPAQASFVLPLLLIVAVFLLTLQRKHHLPGLAVFAAGFLMDVLTAGPLGYWAIVFLLTHSLALFYRARAGRNGFAGLWLTFAGTAALAAAAGWVLASLYFVRVIDWHPMFIGGGVAILLFPLAAWPMRRAVGLVSGNIFVR